MAQIGQIPSSWSGWDSHYSTDNQIGADIAIPQSGIIQAINCYLGHEGGPAGATLAVWSGDTVIASVGVTVPACTAAAGAQGWVQGGVNVNVPAGTYRVGWWRSNTNNYYDFSYGSGGTFYDTTNAGGIGGWSGAAAKGGMIGAYLDFAAGYQIWVDGSQILDVFVDGVRANVFLDGVQLG